MKSLFLMGAAAAVLALAGCDAGPPAVSRAPQAAAQAAAGSAASGGGQASAPAASTDPRDAPVALATDGKPMWAANRKHTAQENADYQFNKNGKDFGAASEAQYVAKTHAF